MLTIFVCSKTSHHLGEKMRPKPFVAQQKTTTEILDFVQNDGCGWNDGWGWNDGSGVGAGALGGLRMAAFVDRG